MPSWESNNKLSWRCWFSRSLSVLLGPLCPEKFCCKISAKNATNINWHQLTTISAKTKASLCGCIWTHTFSGIRCIVLYSFCTGLTLNGTRMKIRQITEVPASCDGVVDGPSNDSSNNHIAKGRSRCHDHLMYTILPIWMTTKSQPSAGGHGLALT